MRWRARASAPHMPPGRRLRLIVAAAGAGGGGGSEATTACTHLDHIQRVHDQRRDDGGAASRYGAVQQGQRRGLGALLRRHACLARRQRLPLTAGAKAMLGAGAGARFQRAPQ